MTRTRILAVSLLLGWSALAAVPSRFTTNAPGMRPLADTRTNAVAEAPAARRPGQAWATTTNRPGVRLPTSSAMQLAHGGNVTLAWDASTDPTVNRYRLYWGAQSRVYTNHVETGSTTAAVSNLAGLVFFAATAVATNDLESGYSSEVSCLVR